MDADQQQPPRTDHEWRDLLSPEQYRILREQGTEPAFTGAYVDEKSRGVYKCAACHAPLFTSSEKYDSRSGWPSFYDAISDSLVLREDRSHGMRRIEVACARCGSHMGHLFPDGPQPTGMRYCINSISLELDREADPDGFDRESEQA